MTEGWGGTGEAHNPHTYDEGRYVAKPDCDRCGFPYHKHNIGSFVFCPIVATYRPKLAVPDTSLEGSAKEQKAPVR